MMKHSSRSIHAAIDSLVRSLEYDGEFVAAERIREIPAVAAIEERDEEIGRLLVSEENWQTRCDAAEADLAEVLAPDAEPTDLETRLRAYVEPDDDSEDRAEIRALMVDAATEIRQLNGAIAVLQRRLDDFQRAIHVQVVRQVQLATALADRDDRAAAKLCATRVRRLMTVLDDKPTDIERRILEYTPPEDVQDDRSLLRDLLDRAADALAEARAADESAGLRAALREALDGWDESLSSLLPGGPALDSNPFMRIDDLRARWRTGRPSWTIVPSSR